MKIFCYQNKTLNYKSFLENSLLDYFSHKTSNNDALNISFDSRNIYGDIEFKKLLEDICDDNAGNVDFMLFKDYLNGKNDKFKLAMSFDKTIFDDYPNFDNLRCHKLSFSNTIFKKGARFRHIDVDEMLFEPRELSADATFFHREKADIENGILRGKEIGKIGKFKYRHQLEGDGTTFLIGMRFTEKAEFTDCVLDKVQFSYLDEDSLLKCYFANSVMGEAIFYNCTFPFNSNAITQFRFIENKNKILRYPVLFLLPCMFILLVASIFQYASKEITTPLDILFIIALFLSIPFILFIASSIFNSSCFMPLMKLLEKITDNRMFELKINRHIATGDDYVAMQNISPDQNKINRETAREVYRQLKNSYVQSGDHQKAGEFYYSQKYWEMVGDAKSLWGFFSSQHLLTDIHHWVNGFGERWLRALVWFLFTMLGFMWTTNPNGDFISTKSTPEYFLSAYKENNSTTSQIHYNHASTTGSISDMRKPPHFMEIATTSYKDDDIKFIKDKNETIIAKQIKDSNKTFYAYDNRFDFYYTSQFIPTLQNNPEVRFAHSLSKMIAPFISEEKKWFQDRSKKAYYLGFVETILLWIFFLAFVFAVKNRIRR